MILTRCIDSGQGWHVLGSLSFSSWRLCHMAAYDERKVWGWLFVSIGFLYFILYFFIAIISKVLPPSNIAVISAMQNDWYYCFLVPLTLPIIVVLVYFHWLSIKMF
ncbi:hypothetical protein HN51_043622 [Arachis hypogaea]